MATDPGVTASAAERMAWRAASELRDHDVVFVGIGLPNLACNLASRLHAPSLNMIYESGVVGSRPERLPVSIGDPALVAGSLGIVSQADIFQCFLQGGRIAVGFLGGAQIDRWGNINTTVIGDYERPKVRLPGSGGACEIATHARRLLIIMRLNRRAFVERCDYITSPGHRVNGVSRRELGLPGGGPEKIITDHGVMTFDETGEAVLTELYPGVSVDDVRAGVGWHLRVADELKTEAEPSAEALRLMREELDPQRLFLK